MKGYIKFILLMVSVISLSACSYQDAIRDNAEERIEVPKHKTEVEPDTKENIGDSSAKAEAHLKDTDNNLKSGYMAAEDEEFYYYSDYRNLIRESKLSGIKEVILDEACRGINLVGDRIITVGNDGLYSIDKKTNSKQLLLDINCAYVQVLGDWIYFINYDDQGCIYRTTLTGDVLEKLNNQASIRLVVVDENNLLYCLENDEYNAYDNFFSPAGRLYKLNIKNKETKCLTEYDVSFVNVVGEWIYYQNVEDEMCLYKMKLDGAEEQVLFQDHAYFINATSDTIYCSDVSTEIYAVDLEGNKKELGIEVARYWDLDKVGNRLYYYAQGLTDSIGYINLITNKQVQLGEGYECDL